ncbi:MAG TPA: hypothetical protein VFZ95_12525 [Steroidobacteraceae bacterium]
MKPANCICVMAALVAASAWAATAPPSAGVWNIAASGKAASSGDLEFRVTSIDGSDPVEISVPVIAGANEQTMARTIRRVMSSQLPRDRYSVELGEGGNVMVSDPRGRPNFTIELLNSDIENVRVAVQSVTPAAAPTVPTQSVPSEAPPVNHPVQVVPGNASPPSSAAPPPITPPKGDTSPVPDPVRVPGPTTIAPPPPPSAPSPAPSAPPGNPPGSPPPGSAPPATPPPNSSGGSGTPATAPPSG